MEIPQGIGELVPFGGMLVGIIAILGGVAVTMTKIIASYRRRALLDEIDATLKLEMIQRGMSPDEITQVLKASTGSSRSLNVNLNGGIAKEADRADPGVQRR